MSKRDDTRDQTTMSDQSKQTWVVLVDWAGGEAGEVYQTADSREEALIACNRLAREVPGCYAEAMTWDEAASLGLVA